MREVGEHFIFPVGIAVCDVNSLSVINATRGQDAGNEKVRQMSVLMREIFPPETYFVRGQDANLIAICSRSDETRMAGYAEKVSQSFHGSIQYGI